MKIKLETSNFHREKNEVKDFISNEISMNAVIKDDFIIIPDDDLDYSQTEIFQIGVAYGRSKEKSIWAEPESVWLPNEYADLFRQAINQYKKETYINVDSISMKEPTGNITEIIFKPTQAMHLVNIGRNYSILLQQEKKES